MATYVLFEARYSVPANEGALCAAFNFTTREVKKAPSWEKALLDPRCQIIVTGLIPALTQFIAEYSARWTRPNDFVWRAAKGYREAIPAANAEQMPGYYHNGKHKSLPLDGFKPLRGQLHLQHYDQNHNSYWLQQVL